MIRVIFFIIFLLSAMVLISQPKAQDFDKVPDALVYQMMVFSLIYVDSHRIPKPTYHLALPLTKAYHLV